jgi:hypothetical protein
MCTIFSIVRKHEGNCSLSFFLSFFKSLFHSVLKTKGKKFPRSDKNKERGGGRKPTDAMFFLGKESLTFYSQQLQLGVMAY